MALDQPVLSELLDAFRTGEGRDVVRPTKTSPWGIRSAVIDGIQIDHLANLDRPIPPLRPPR
jgi:hypothetical protein